jgi:hypothetical protein
MTMTASQLRERLNKAAWVRETGVAYRASLREFT